MKKKKTIKTIKLTTPADREPSLLANNINKRSIIDLSEEGLKRFTYFFPFVASALLVYRFQIVHFQTFSLFLAITALGYHCASTLTLRHRHSSPNYKFTLYYGVEIILILIQYNLTSDAEITLMILAFLGMGLLRGLLAFTSPLAIILGGVGLIIEVSIVSVLGVYSQEQQLTIDVLKVGILGLVPGCVLASALVIENLELFEKQGWQRSKFAPNRKGIDVRRPKGISQCYSLLLVIGPIIAISQVFFQITNNAPFGYLITLISASKLSQAFLDETLEAKVLLKKTLNLAALTAALGLPIGLYASM